MHLEPPAKYTDLDIVIRSIGSMLENEILRPARLELQLL
jgi:hypothetical protein